MRSPDVPTKPVVLFLTNGSALMRFGGASLRYAALESALRQCATVIRFRVRCPDEADCAHAADAPGSSESLTFESGADFYSAYCSIAADDMRRVLDERRPNIVIGSGLDMWRYLRIAQRSADVPCILDVLNADSLLAGEVAGEMARHPHGTLFDLDQEAALRAIEAAAFEWMDQVWACTQIDADRLARLHGIPAERLIVMPNTVAPPARRPTGSTVDRVLFLGRLDWFPNYLAAEFVLDEIVPRLQRSHDPLPALLAGFDPPEPLRRRSLPPGAELLASPATIDQLWAGSVLIVPLTLGGGSRLKILEAFAAGAAVVSSAKGIEGIDATDGVHYLQAETAAETVEAVLRLRSDEVLRDRLTSAAYDLLTTRYTPDCLVATMSHGFDRLLAANRAG